ncbi:hypothetical protein Rmet_6513 [Cupriavidus metallidurans CH34]|uniref:Uncharacterized protein n=1 Tax=Cupriavidus metallidurans (strain ATCC 43123 / DSM 2839 / NBRC 102507 / CH34) TaxID=266264 RepID=D3DXV1_CUPMC|nr:hypothetical protein Rmet_6513 [Cupriavidus metallidurans CH34]
MLSDSFIFASVHEIQLRAILDSHGRL